MSPNSSFAVGNASDVGYRKGEKATDNIKEDTEAMKKLSFLRRSGNVQ